MDLILNDLRMDSWELDCEQSLRELVKIQAARIAQLEERLGEHYPASATAKAPESIW